MIPNVTLSAQVPADFCQLAERLGLTTESYLWLLAESACVRQPESVTITRAAASVPRPGVLIPFPAAGELDIAAPGLPTMASRLAEVRTTLARARNRRIQRPARKEEA